MEVYIKKITSHWKKIKKVVLYFGKVKGQNNWKNENWGKMSSLSFFWHTGKETHF